MKHTNRSTIHPVLKLIERLDQVGDKTPESLHGEARLSLIQLYDRNTALVAALREARDYLDSLLNATPEEAIDFLTNNGEDVTDELSDALHIDAFDVGDTVLAHSTDLDLSEYEGVITSKRITLTGLALFTVTDSEDNGNDHEPHEMRLAD